MNEKSKDFSNKEDVINYVKNHINLNNDYIQLKQLFDFFLHFALLHYFD